MKTFREHLNEEVKIGALASGGIDIERDAVRDEINGILAAIASKPCITPYWSLNKIRKALAYFSIFLPKKVYLEGRHGVEVWEISQFGDKMGFTDQGDWIHHVPAKYHLFFHYHRMGSMYYLEAKIVDEKELETRVNAVERMVSEEMDAATRQSVAKAVAPKEKPHTALGDCDCSQGDSPSTKDAVKVSMKKIDEEMSHDARELATYADNHAQLHRSSHQPIIKNLQRKHAKGSYDHGKAEKLWGYHAKRAADAYHKEHGHKFSVAHRKEAAKHMADSARDEHGFGSVKEGWVAISRNGPIYDKFGDVNPNAKFYGRKRPVNKPGDAEPGAGDTYKGSKQGGKVKTAKTVKEETVEEGRMPASVIKHKQKLAAMTPEEKRKHFSGKTKEELERMAHRHGYGKNSAAYSKYVTEDEQIDELYGKGKLKGIIAARQEKEDQAKREYNAAERKMMDARSETGKAEKVKEKLRLRNISKPGDPHYNWAHSKKKLREEEQIDEISKGLVKRYKKAAESDRKNALSSAETSHAHRKNRALPLAKRNAFHDEEKWLKGIAKKREKGIAMADKRLDELSTGTLVNYMAKSGRQQDNIELPYGFKHKDNWRSADKEKYEKREKGRKLAHKKLTGKAKVGSQLAKHPYMEETISEKAPPGAKFERMVKHIKAGYAKDGLTKKEKGIAYATAWKAKKRESED